MFSIRNLYELLSKRLNQSFQMNWKFRMNVLILYIHLNNINNIKKNLNNKIPMLESVSNMHRIEFINNHQCANNSNSL